MKNSSLFSLIMAQRNQKKLFLEQAVLSVVNQKDIDFGNLELIIVDDRSDKKCLSFLKEIVEKIKIKQPKLKIFIIKNKQKIGQGNSLNAGVKFCHAEYFGKLDSDDMLKPTAVSRVLSKIKNNKNLDLIFSNHIKTDETARKILYETKKARLFNLHKQYKNSLLDPLFHMNFLAHFLVIKKKAWQKAGGFFNISPGQDHDLALKISHLTKKVNFGLISRPLYIYRTNSQSVTQKNRQLCLKRAKKNLLFFLKQHKYSVTAVRYIAKIGPSNSSYYDLFLNSKKVGIPWFKKIQTASAFDIYDH